MTRFLVDVGLLLAAFVGGIVLSTKIKDLIAGIPASARAEITKLEAAVIAKFRRPGS